MAERQRQSSTEFAKVYDLRVFCEEVRAMAEAGQVSCALEAVAQFVREVILRQTSWATVLSSPELDALCQELGRLPPRIESQRIDHERAVFLVTAVYGVGGHTRVMMDLIHADSATRKTVLVSNVFHDLDAAEVRSVLQQLDPSVEIELAPKGDMNDTLVWVQKRLAALSPVRCYLLQHNYDAALVAAVQPELTNSLFYYHHCDHSLALGVHLDHAIHVDFNSKLFHHCRKVKGVLNNVFWPLAAGVTEHRAEMEFISSGRLITATSGGLPKFDTSYLPEWIPYRHDYKHLAPQIIAATGGVHIHIGPLGENVLELIYSNIISSGIERERFIHLPRVDNLAAELVRRKVDLYIGSFPVGGGRATVEVMGAGIPSILHDNYASVLFSDINEAYPGVLCWRNPDELIGILRSLDAETLADHAHRARAHYEGQFTLSKLRDAISSTLAGAPVQPPSPPPEHHPNALQHWLDQRVREPRFEAKEPEAKEPEAKEPDIQVGGYRSIREADAAASRLKISTKQIAAILLRRFAVVAKRRILRR